MTRGGANTNTCLHLSREPGLKSDLRDRVRTILTALSATGSGARTILTALSANGSEGDANARPYHLHQPCSCPDPLGRCGRRAARVQRGRGIDCTSLLQIPQVPDDQRGDVRDPEIRSLAGDRVDGLSDTSKFQL